MKRLVSVLLTAIVAVGMTALGTAGALAFGGPDTDQMRKDNLYCYIHAERTMVHTGDEVRVYWESQDNTITGYRINPVPHNDGFVPNTKGTGFITVEGITEFTLFVRSSPDKWVRCHIHIGIWPNRVTWTSSTPDGSIAPPPVCSGSGCPPPPSCTQTNTCPPPPPSCEDTNSCPPPPSCEDDNSCPPPPPPPEDNGKCNNGVGNGVDCQPPGNPPPNDDPGTGPGNPGNQGGTPGNGPPDGKGPK